MRPYDGNSDDFDDIEGLVYERSQTMHRLVNDARREERHRNRHRNYAKRRYHDNDWDWDDGDDWDSYLDDVSAEFYRDTNSQNF
ncbi:MAG: hypothetical protein QNJ19_08325 [Woeseiaceae bacterium]|nr:hypothetical protein [Woeseiaceae bacterium]